MVLKITTASIILSPYGMPRKRFELLQAVPKTAVLSITPSGLCSSVCGRTGSRLHYTSGGVEPDTFPPSQTHKNRYCNPNSRADSEGFELSEPFGSVLFKSTALDRSANCPCMPSVGVEPTKPAF